MKVDSFTVLLAQCIYSLSFKFSSDVLNHEEAMIISFQIFLYNPNKQYQSLDMELLDIILKYFEDFFLKTETANNI
jgi:hypothetical protein